MSRAVFLDRDGVINNLVIRDGRAEPPLHVEDFELLPEVRKACAMLTSEGYLLVVATNQPDVGRGILDGRTLLEMHHVMCRLLPIRRVEVSCDPLESPESLLRKPNPGMLFRAAEDLGIDLSRSYMVGDSWSDVECGRRAGCQTFYIDRGRQTRLRPASDFHARDLLDAARQIVTMNQNPAIENSAWEPALSGQV